MGDPGSCGLIRRRNPQQAADEHQTGGCHDLPPLPSSTLNAETDKKGDQRTCSSIVLITRAGLPTATVPGGIGLETIAPAPIVVPGPTSAITIAPAPIQQSDPMSTVSNALWFAPSRLPALSRPC